MLTSRGGRQACDTVPRTNNCEEGTVSPMFVEAYRLRLGNTSNGGPCLKRQVPRQNFKLTSDNAHWPTPALSIRPFAAVRSEKITSVLDSGHLMTISNGTEPYCLLDLRGILSPFHRWTGVTNGKLGVPFPRSTRPGAARRLLTDCRK